MCQFSLEQVSGSFGPKIKSFWEGGSFRPKSLGLGREMKSGVRSSVDPALEGALLVDCERVLRLIRGRVVRDGAHQLAEFCYQISLCSNLCEILV